MKSNLEKSEAGNVRRVAVQMPTVINEQGELVLLDSRHQVTRTEPDYLHRSLPVDVSSPNDSQEEQQEAMQNGQLK